MAAAKHRLSNLTVLIDYNKVQSYGRTVDVLDLEPIVDKFRSFGFVTEEVDGHDVGALETVFRKLPFVKNAPSAVVCHTVKGKGLPFAEGNPEWHHKSGLTELDFQKMYEIFS
jgi:transketolase